MEKNMNDILKDVESLKDLIKDSKKYKDYIEINNILDNNEEINNIIKEIKNLQKIIVNKEVKKYNTNKEEKELTKLFDKLYSFREYKDYIEISKRLNKIITKIQKRFEDEFNNILN